MDSGARRPFHAEYAWAFDILIDPARPERVRGNSAWLVGLDIPPGAEVLDAGCGTGRHSIELARRGYIVHGVDLSPELIEIVLAFGSNFDVPRCPLRYRM